MGIRIDQSIARQRLADAVAWARSGRPVPLMWTDFIRLVDDFEEKTYVPALGTALLARATDPRIDPLAIKESYSDRAYSLRTLGHNVLVPAASREGFSIRSTGREPLNNQPFFRYDHMDEIDRVRNPSNLHAFRNGLRVIERSSANDALAALAAFVRYGFEVAAARQTFTIGPGVLGLEELREAIMEFLDTDRERPKRVQALVAAAFDTGHPDVRTRKINDPSRDFPGDVQVYVDDQPVIAAEARGKSVPTTEASAFVRSCSEHGIDRAYIVVLWDRHERLDRSVYSVAWHRHRVALRIIESPITLLREAIAWSGCSASAALASFIVAALYRLREIECRNETLAEWVQLTSS